MGGGRKRPFSETEEQIDSNQPNLDLSLSLSPPDSGSSHQTGEEPLNIIPSSHSCTPLSSASTQRSCTSVTLSKSANEELHENGGQETHSLVVMGCGRCLMYIMVSEVDPMCPKCKTSALIDIFRGAKRVKKEENSSSKSN
ncbi:hypothetical protein SLA2020_235730 [Shorea laevis]